MTLSLLVLSRDAAGISKFLGSNDQAIKQVAELRLVINPDARFGGQARLANALKRSALGTVCGVVHADTIFSPGGLEALASAALGGKVCGMVGAMLGRSPSEKNVWGNAIDREIEVSTVDGCSIFFKADAPVEFDEERFPTWHCVNEDFCLSASKAGLAVAVVPALATHRGESTFLPAWQEEYWKYRRILDEKWAGTVFETT